MRTNPDIDDIFKAGLAITQMGKTMLMFLGSLHRYATSDKLYAQLKLPETMGGDDRIQRLSLRDFRRTRAESVETWRERFASYCKYTEMRPVLDVIMDIIIEKRNLAMSERGFFKKAVMHMISDDGAASACYMYYDYILYEMLAASAEESPAAAVERIEKLVLSLDSAITDLTIETPTDEAITLIKNTECITKKLNELADKYRELSVKVTVARHLGSVTEALRNVFVDMFSEFRSVLSGNHLNDTRDITAIRIARHSSGMPPIAEQPPCIQLLYLFYHAAPLKKIICDDGVEPNSELFNVIGKLLETKEFVNALLAEDVEYLAELRDGQEIAGVGYITRDQVERLKKQLPALNRGKSLLTSSYELGRGNKSIFRFIGKAESEVIAINFVQALATLSRLSSLYTNLKRMTKAIGIVGDAFVKYSDQGFLGIGLLGELLEENFKLLRNYREHLDGKLRDALEVIEKRNTGQSNCLIANHSGARKYRNAVKTNDTNIRSGISQIKERLEYISQLEIQNALVDLSTSVEELVSMADSLELKSEKLEMLRDLPALPVALMQSGAGAGAGAGAGSEYTAISSITLKNDEPVKPVEHSPFRGAAAEAGRGMEKRRAARPVSKLRLESVEDEANEVSTATLQTVSYLQTNPSTAVAVQPVDQPVPAPAVALNDRAIFAAVDKAKRAYEASGNRYSFFGFGCMSSLRFGQYVRWGDLGSMRSLSLGKALAGLGAAASSWKIRNIGPNSFRIYVLTELADTLFGAGQHPYTSGYNWQSDYKPMMVQLLWQSICGNDFYQEHLDPGKVFVLPSQRELNLMPLQKHLNDQLLAIVDTIIDNTSATDEEARKQQLEQVEVQIERLKYLRIDSSKIFATNSGRILLSDLISKLAEGETLVADARTNIHNPAELLVLEDRLDPLPLLLPVAAAASSTAGIGALEYQAAAGAH